MKNKILRSKVGGFWHVKIGKLFRDCVAKSDVPENPGTPHFDSNFEMPSKIKRESNTRTMESATALHSPVLNPSDNANSQVITLNSLEYTDF
jgi:hypothetical protein